MKTLSSLADDWAVRYPHDPAVIYQDQAIDFKTLARRSRRVARGLHRLGIGKGDRVGLWLPNVPAYVILCLACARLGATIVGINIRYGPAEVEDLIARTRMSAIVLWPAFAGRDYLDALGEIDYGVLRRLKLMVRYTETDTAELIPGGLEHCYRERYRKLLQRSEHPTDDGGPDQDAVIFTTSGTTALPKLAVHRQGSIAHHCAMIARHFGYGRENYRAWDRLRRPGAVLGIIPLTGIFGFSTCFGALAAGRPVVLETAFDAEKTVDAIERHDVRFLSGTDDIVLPLLAADPREHALPGVAFAAGGSFNGDIVALGRQAAERGLAFCGAFGMSELQALISRQPLDKPPPDRALGGGVPIDPEVSIRVLDPENGAIQTAGEPGELAIRAPSMMHRYDGDTAATDAAITPDGYFRTGDLGHATGNGNEFIYSARLGDAMRLGGYLVHPSEIETVIETVTGVRQSHVVAVPVPHPGGAKMTMRCVAFVKSVPGSGDGLEQAVQSACRHQVAHYKVPYKVIPVEAFPMVESANGIKVKRAELRRLALEKLNLNAD